MVGRVWAPIVPLAALLIATGSAFGEAARAPLSDIVIKSAATISAAELRARLRFLASDELEGRAVGHRGNEVAARYLATALEQIGVTPASGDFYQPVELYTGTLGSGNLLTLRENTPRRETPYRVGDDFAPHPVSVVKTVTAPVMFAGYGITAPEFGYDDYAGLDAQGRIVIALQHEPGETDAKSRFDGSEMTRHAEIETKIETAHRHGAVGLLLVHDVRNHPSRPMRPLRTMWPEAPSPRRTHYELRERVDANSMAVAFISVEVAEQLTGGGAGRTIEALEKAADAAAERSAKGAPNASFAVAGKAASLTVDIARRVVPAPNVIGMVEGRDRSLRNELVVIGAHFDHDGVTPEGGVYNGADDDGSGTVTVMEIAEAFAAAVRAGTRPKRSVVFALWNGEERGLLGSAYFATNPVPRGGRTVANVNLDMVGRDEEIPDPSNPRYAGLPKRIATENINAVHLLAYSYSPELAAIFKEENADVGLRLRTEYDKGAQNLLRRSDHWPFLQQGIPALFVTTGLHPDYHTPQDDIEKINFDKMEKIARLCYRVLWRLADAEELPRYVNPQRFTTEP